MSVFDLFRGFFGVPGGNIHGDGRRDPLFDDITRHDEDDDDDEECFYSNDYQGSQRDPFDDQWRFGFSFGPDGMRVQEPPVFGQVFREMEEIFSQLGHWENQSRDFGVPGIEAPPSMDKPERGRGASCGNSLRDFMLKSSDDPPQKPPAGPPACPRENDSPLSSQSPRLPSTPFGGLIPFSKFHDIWSGKLQRVPEEQRREDGDLDSAVLSGGLDQILTPPPAQSPYQPKNRSFFQSVTVIKVVKSDGTVEERRTVSDGQGNEETTVTRSGGLGTGPQDPARPLHPGGAHPLPDMKENLSLFSDFFKGFK